MEAVAAPHSHDEDAARAYFAAKRSTDAPACPPLDFVLEHREEIPEPFALTFKRKPAGPIHDARSEMACLTNLAESAEHAAVMEWMRGTGAVFGGDPRFHRMRPDLDGFAGGGVYNPQYQW